MHLPATEEELDAITSTDIQPRGQIKARLLLVEDNDEVAKITEQMLTSSGLTVTRVANAFAALEYLRSAAPAPEIVLSDIAMPGDMNGIELALELERLHPELPVILNTGYAEQIEEATSRGMRVFQKPVSPEVLLNELRTLLDSKKNNSAL
jgi:two-component system NtrC family sensor kinase